MRVPHLDFPPTVPSLLRRAVVLYGDGDHVVSAADRLSFSSAEQRSAVFARRLLAAGVGKGTKVGIALPSSTAFEVALLAAARIGAVAMLFSSTYRPGELQRVIRNADIDTLVVPKKMIARDYLDQVEQAIPGLSGHPSGPLYLESAPFLRTIWVAGEGDRQWGRSVDLTVTDDSGPDLVPQSLLKSVERQVCPADLLLAIFTSGTSADPKAVLHTHGATVRKVHPSTGLGLQNSTPGARVFMVMPFFWVGGPQSLLGSLHTGSTVLCQERFEAEEALALIEKERASHVAGWATMVQTLKDHPRAKDFDLSSLQAAAQPWQQRSSRGDPINMGMTETFGMHRNRNYFDYKVIDRETGESLPDGEVGEFCVRGFGLTAGLYRQEREETFDSDGWYHTGDGGYLEQGQVYFTGRFSEMIKSSGANVAPLEVEMALQTFPEVLRAYVLGIPDPARSEEVVAVVVPQPGTSIDADDLMQRLRRQLSSYKVPTRIIELDENSIPTLASGKPDKRRLASELTVERLRPVSAPRTG